MYSLDTYVGDVLSTVILIAVNNGEIVFARREKSSGVNVSIFNALSAIIQIIKLSTAFDGDERNRLVSELDELDPQRSGCFKLLSHSIH